MSTIRFVPRWREELVATSKEGTLIFELTMGEYHVYFPSETKWLTAAPHWAREKWTRYLKECTDWCDLNKIPISIVEDGHVYEEK